MDNTDYLHTIYLFVFSRGPPYMLDSRWAGEDMGGYIHPPAARKKGWVNDVRGIIISAIQWHASPQAIEGGKPSPPPRPPSFWQLLNTPSSITIRHTAVLQICRYIAHNRRHRRKPMHLSMSDIFHHRTPMYLSMSAQEYRYHQGEIKTCTYWE